MSEYPTQNTEEDDDHDLQDEDLDAFLLLLESRLRADFTSPDLSRTIASQGTSSSSSSSSRVGAIGGGGGGAATSTLPSGNPSTPSKFLRLIGKVLHRAGKPIKLRALMSVLGLESDRILEKQSNTSNSNNPMGYSSIQANNQSHMDLEEQKTDYIVWKLLSKAEEDDEEWVRIVAGILRGMMFCTEDEIDDILNATSAAESSQYKPPSCRGKAAEKQLRKITEGVLKDVRKSLLRGSERLERVTKNNIQSNSQSHDNDDNKNGEATTKQQQRLESLLIKQDACPTFLPFQYSLLSPETISSIIPEINHNAHFTPQTNNLDIFKIDAEVEEKRAEDEEKEMQLQKQRTVALTNHANGVGRGGGVGDASGGRGGMNGRSPNDAVMAGRMRGRFSNMGGRGGRGTTDTAASLLRPSRPGMMVGRGAGAVGRGRAAGMAGRAGGRLGTPAAGRGVAAASAGRGGMMMNRMGIAGRLGGGRVAATAASRTPLQRRVPGSTRAMLNASGRGGGAGGRGETKMKVIDVTEVEGLNRAQKEREKKEQLDSEARRAEKKRRLLEQTAKSGLRNNRDDRTNRAGPVTTEAQGGQPRDTNLAETEKQSPATDPFPLPEGAFLEAFNADHGNGPHDHLQKHEEANNHHQQHDQQSQQLHHNHHQPQQQQGLESLLEKSNKLSDQDRRNIYQFFQNRELSNPIPSADPNGDSLWKVKLNEEKTTDPQTGEVVKETLYLELDYQSFGYKKTRKIKRK